VNTRPYRHICATSVGCDWRSTCFLRRSLVSCRSMGGAFCDDLPYQLGGDPATMGTGVYLWT
jgi:hypothetical protein